MALTASFKRAGASQYSWYGGNLPMRKMGQRVGFQLPYDVVLPHTVDRIVAEIKAAKLAAVDTETTSLDPDVAKLCCVSFCLGGQAYVAVVQHSEEEYVLPRHLFLQIMWALFEAPKLGFFNGNYDYRILRNCVPEIPWRKIHGRTIDAQGLVYLSDTNISDWTLKSASRFFLGVDPPEFDENSWGENIFITDIKQLVYYSAFDAWDTWQLIALFYPPMLQIYGSIIKLDNRVLLPLVEYEENEITVDWELMVEYSDQTLGKIEKVKDNFYSKYGMVNLGSNKQKAELLQKLGFDTGEKTETNQMSVGIKALDKIKDRCEAASLMIEFSKLQKLQSSYISPMLERKSSGLPVRFKYRGYRTKTYRFAAGSYAVSRKKKLKNMGYWIALNVQSAPKPKIAERPADFDPTNFTWNFHDKGRYLVETGADGLTWRKAFKSPEDSVWISSDFSGQELVVVTNLSQEPVWMEALMNGEDLHKKMAILIWGEANYDKNKRKLAKSANFGIIYGGTEYTLHKNLNIPLDQAKFIVDQMKKAVPTLFQWIEKMHDEARRVGYVTNAYGLPRRLLPYYRMGKSWAGFADRSAVNTVVQSCGSVIIRLAFYRLWEMLEDKLKDKYEGKVEFKITIHDELNLICHKSVLMQFLQDFDALLYATNLPSWKLKGGVEHSIGSNWAEVGAVSLIRDTAGAVVGLDPKGEVIDHAKRQEAIDAAAAVAKEEADDVFFEDWEENEEAV